MSPRRMRDVAVHEYEPAEHTRSHADVVGEEEVLTSTTPGPAYVVHGFVQVLVGFISVFLLAIEAALGFRLVFLMANANPNSGFVDFIYDVTDDLAEPFQGIVANQGVNGGFFEPAGLIAMAVYFIATALVVLLLWSLSRVPAPAGERSTMVRRHHGHTGH